MGKRVGKHTVILPSGPGILGYASVVGQKEGEGPLKKCFDQISADSYFGEKSWEKAETKMLRQCFSSACQKAGLSSTGLDLAFAGDLLNQCVSSAFAMKDTDIPYLGLYGACSTMAESLALSAMMIDGGFADTCCALTGSHFCSAERQYRFPLEYGGQRTPSSQWTVTGAGAVILSRQPLKLRIRQITIGKIVDAGITDVNHMGAAMAPAAYDTLRTHFADTARSTEDYDAIFTGDLGALGHDIVTDLFSKDGVALENKYQDCGVLIYDREKQNVNAGGSGCGCSAAVLCGYILPRLEKGLWKRILFAATGALLSSTSAMQGCSIPGICHAVVIERED